HSARRAFECDALLDENRTTVIAGFEHDDIARSRPVEGRVHVFTWPHHQAFGEGRSSEGGGQCRRPNRQCSNTDWAHYINRSAARPASGPASPCAWRGRTSCSSTSRRRPYPP